MFGLRFILLVYFWSLGHDLLVRLESEVLQLSQQHRQYMFGIASPLGYLWASMRIMVAILESTVLQLSQH